MKQELTSKKVFIRTLGCQMNARDSEVICGLLQKAGYKIIDDAKAADIVIFNTCSVRQHAEDRVWSEIGAINKLRVRSSEIRDKKKLIIGIVGCMANNYRETIFARAPEVDFVVGTSDIGKIPEILNKLLAIDYRQPDMSLFKRKIFETDGDYREDYIYHTGFHLDRMHAFVVIQEGCENYCSYCVVPYVRGKMRSRDPIDIIKEIKEDIAAGITKITLLGQNVNSYNFKEVVFLGLLHQVNKIEGLKEFDFITSHPKNTTVELFKAMPDCEKLTKHLHLPVQSGSDRILKLMNRGYSRKLYLDLVKNYRKIVKGGALSTDIIVGFPGESEEDFEDTYNLIKAVRFNSAYIFKYSPRPNTAALKYEDDVPKQEKERRHSLILELQRKISKEKRC